MAKRTKITYNIRVRYKKGGPVELIPVEGMPIPDTDFALRKHEKGNWILDQVPTGYTAGHYCYQATARAVAVALHRELLKYGTVERLPKGFQRWVAEHRLSREVTPYTPECN